MKRTGTSISVTLMSRLILNLLALSDHKTVCHRHHHYPSGDPKHDAEHAKGGRKLAQPCDQEVSAVRLGSKVARSNNLTPQSEVQEDDTRRHSLLSQSVYHRSGQIVSRNLGDTGTVLSSVQLQPRGLINSARKRATIRSTIAAWQNLSISDTLAFAPPGSA